MNFHVLAYFFTGTTNIARQPNEKFDNLILSFLLAPNVFDYPIGNFEKKLGKKNVQQDIFQQANGMANFQSGYFFFGQQLTFTKLGCQTGEFCNSA